MKALIAFVIMGILVATLIEVNERIKVKRTKEASNSEEVARPKDDCKESCADCSLLSVCEKEDKNKH